MTRTDEIALSIFARHRREGFAHIEAADRLAVSLSVLRRCAPRAFAHLTETDTECAAIAVRRRWVHEPQPWQRTPEEIAHAEALVRETIAGFRQDQVKAPLRPTARHLTPEQLAATKRKAMHERA